MLKMIVFVPLLAFFTFIAPTYGQEVLPWLEGHWEGVGYQVPTDSHWEIELTFDSLNAQLLIEYPSLSCSGHWELVDSREGYAEFVERITEGVDKCDNGGKVVVTQIDSEYLSVAYFLPEYYDGVVAQAVLRKIQVVKVKIPVPSGKVKRT
ncbi:MAG: hypothetical protein KDC34_17140 [Saprospiraceae bacterium]|nr:hypothetical protein [Saprospiraceae bacterium]